MIKNYFQYKRIRVHLIWNLVLSFLLIACRESRKGNEEITIRWNNEKAEAIIIPSGLIPKTGAISEQLQVRLVNNPVPVIAEEVNVNSETISFKPLIAFTPGMKYEVLFAGKLVDQFEIPALNTKDITEVITVYPTADTLPENTLKLYIVFSKPMQEGQALQHIRFIRNDTDTVPVFLDLAHELWNKERTTLTLWVDPGRIKRDLQPNLERGMPLQQNNRYRLIIDRNWRDERGLELKSNYEKRFYVGERDNVSPDPAKWDIHTPRASTKDPLIIDLHEALDYLLLKNALSITNSSGNIINGNFDPFAKETNLRFTPVETWKAGEYMINVEARLEDQAGNNLDRLFDTDLIRADKKNPQIIFRKKVLVK